VFQHAGALYMLPEGFQSGALRLYRAEKFPTEWVLDKVLIDHPLVDATIITPEMAAQAGFKGGRWYILASSPRRKSSKRCRELEVWHADSLHGEWRLHPSSPVHEWVQGSRMAGRPVVVDGKLYRFGQDCGRTYGHRMKVYRVTELSDSTYDEEEVVGGLGWDPTNGRVGESAWNGERYHHMDAHQLPSGEWIAVMDGDRYVSDYLKWRFAHRAMWLLPLSAAIGALVLALWMPANSIANVSPCVLHSVAWCAAASHLSLTVLEQCMTSRASSRSGFMSPSGRRSLSGSPTGDGLGRMSGGGAPWDVPPASSRSSRHLHRSTWQLCLLWASKPQRRLLGLSVLQALYLVLGLYLVYSCLLWFGPAQALKLILWWLRANGGPLAPVPVQGQASKFTIVVMSYEARMLTLKAFVPHYSRCASVAEILIVWNKGLPPDVGVFNSQVPVRIRVEGSNSINNRFKPDARITTRGVLQLDDDILMPCSDLERGFARWREHPERVTGYYPRLLEGDPPGYQCKVCEKHTYQTGHYNIILTGAAFIDGAATAELYYSDAMQQARDYVDANTNCEDLLMNYMMAAHLKGKQHVEWVRPSMRFDVGRLTKLQLSGGAVGAFGPQRHNCTRVFTQMFNNPLKGKAYPLNWDGMGKPVCVPVLGCLM